MASSGPTNSSPCPKPSSIAPMILDTSSQSLPLLELPAPAIPSSPEAQIEPQSSSPESSPTDPLLNPSPFPFLLLPPELRVLIYNHVIASAPLPRTIRIKIRLPLHSCSYSRVPAAYTVLPVVPKMMHMSSELRHEFDRTVSPSLNSPLYVFETQGYDPDMRRRLLFKGLGHVETFCRGFREEGQLSGWRVDAVAITHGQSKSDVETRIADVARVLVKMVMLFGASVKSVYLVTKLRDGEGERARLVGDVYRKLEEWRRGGAPEGVLVREEEMRGKRVPVLLVVRPDEMRLRVGRWTVVSVR